MLNINPFINFKGTLKTEQKNSQNQNNYQNINSSFLKSLNLNNLKPLAKDSVSFNFGNNLNRALLEAIDNKEICKQLHGSAKRASENLHKVLTLYLADCITTPDNQKIVERIDGRIKSAESIREKSTDIFEAEFQKREPKFFNIKNKDVIKSRLHDIIGERITMHDATEHRGDLVLDKIIQAVKDGKLKIVRIENYVPANLDSELEYFSKEKLEELKDAVNSKLSEDGIHVTIEEKQKSTGYMALHLDVDLSDGNKLTSNQDKYFGEIQIVGKDVAALKEVEDFCYKLKSNKNIKNDDENYRPFAHYFSQNYKYKSKEFVKNFDLYTSRAYLIQRKKKPQDNNGLLPTIEECHLEGKIPKALDFNLLKEFKECSDRMTEIQNNPQKVFDEIVKRETDKKKVS